MYQLTFACPSCGQRHAYLLSGDEAADMIMVLAYEGIDPEVVVLSGRN